MTEIIAKRAKRIVWLREALERAQVKLRNFEKFEREQTPIRGVSIGKEGYHDIESMLIPEISSTLVSILKAEIWQYCDRLEEEIRDIATNMLDDPGE